MSHQIGSFAGAFGGGILFDLAWKLIVGIGFAAGLTQLSFALVRSPPPRLATS